ncbi:MAG TPA: NAD-dependent epimerase/dehydratase family protein [Sphingopyxis sp.]|uniref:NAD-dependent epimerase/dehydratase family protein n=1 Tax=Sphingopyxis sp. TaxID=1908224 RepID=UPI002D188374|nr:NAD-dependent epimerase/dehydratase family protein [Sphingopyxis sp.]HWW55901.1 NAD-dependent epimerase/dehydratase family protein [Sphingopyxis sp.]
MTRDRTLVIGANGELGQALLRELGAERAIAVTRTANAPLSGFDHVRIGPDNSLPAATLGCCAAIINAAGSVTGDDPTMRSSNINLPRTIARAAKVAGVPRLVQVSSFSILGTAEHIDDTTEERPINAYGRSKAEAEHMLLGLSGDGFTVECVRLPFLFSVSKPGLLSPLISLAKRFRNLPTSAGRPLRRSMITYADAAHQLAMASKPGSSGISFAADPRLFDYTLLAAALAEETGMKIRILPVPRTIVAGIDRFFPAIGRRLFRSSVLDPRVNRAGDRPLGLEEELRELVRSA